MCRGKGEYLSHPKTVPLSVHTAFRVLETRDSAHSVELAFERAGGVLQGAPRTFRADCIWYRPPTQVAGLGIGNFCLLHHSHYPESSFIIGTPAAAGDSPGRAQPTPRVGLYCFGCWGQVEAGWSLVEVASGLVEAY